MQDFLLFELQFMSSLSCYRPFSRPTCVNWFPLVFFTHLCQKRIFVISGTPLYRPFQCQSTEENLKVLPSSSIVLLRDVT